MRDFRLARRRDITRTMNALRATIQAMRVNSRAIEREIGLSLAQLNVLEQLADRAAASITDLAERTSTHQSSVSCVVDRLVRRGFVVRRSCAADRRRSELALSAAGWTILGNAPTSIQAALVRSLQSLPAVDRSRLGELLHKLVVIAEIEVVGTAAEITSPRIKHSA